MNQNLNLNEILNRIKATIRKIHYVVLLIFIIGMITVTTITVTNMLNSRGGETPTSTSTSSTSTDNFSKDPTLPKVEKLEFSGSSSDVTLPSNQRLNPFDE